MRVLLTHRPGGAYGFISEGWLQTLKRTGHTVQRWDGQADSWHKFEPDVYIGCSGHRQPIPENRKNCQVALHVNPYGPDDIKGINESPDAISWVLKQRPDAVFGYGFDQHFRFWSHWRTKHGIQWVPMPTAVDVYSFAPRETAKRFDLCYLGGRWPYKAQSIDQYLLPLLNDKMLSFQLGGWGIWPIEENQPGQRHWKCFRGEVSDSEASLILSQGRVGPCISEPHTKIWGIDLPERVFKVISMGAVAIHDPVPGLQDILPEVPIASGPEDFFQLCYKYGHETSDSDLRELVNAQRKRVFSRHTYHHRLSGLFGALGFHAVAERLGSWPNHLDDQNCPIAAAAKLI